VKIILHLPTIDTDCNITFTSMSTFAGKWEKPNTQSFGTRVKESVRNPGPLKPRLDLAVRQIQVQVAKLDSTTNKLRERDNSIFAKVVASLQKHDTQHASVFANELAEIRKMNKMVTQAKLALEQIVLRLNTITELGDIVVTLTPAMAVIRNVKQGLVGVLPEAENEIGEISGLLSSILVDAGTVGGYSLNFEAANEDAEKILAEASAVAETRMREKFPEIPSTLPSTESTTSEGTSY
jgi:division protein CdvB (Snf7/Vps24/ESCRT-III family)